MKPVTVRRWEVVAAFVLFFAVVVGWSFWTDHRIANAERRITRNATIALSAKIDAQEAQRENRIQDRIRRELVAALRVTDMNNCRKIETLKDQLRIIVARSDAALEELRGQIADNLIERAHAQNRAALHDLQATACNAPPG